ncbi:5003_t:CDS:1, partial [Acaulospora colombiana]
IKLIKEFLPDSNDFSERDTTDQRIGKIDEVIAVVSDLVEGVCTWDEACGRLPAYSGVQAIENA